MTAVLARVTGVTGRQSGTVLRPAGFALPAARGSLAAFKQLALVLARAWSVARV
jgi:hypothetical protein